MMPTLSLQMDLSFSGKATLISKSGSDYAPRGEAPAIVVRSKLYTDLLLIDVDDGATNMVIDAGWTITLTAKKKVSDAPSGDLLFGSSAFVATVIGDETWYRALIDFSATPMRAALAAAGKMDAIAEVIVMNADASVVHRKTFDCTFTAPVYVPEDEIPAEDVVDFLNAQQIAAIYIPGTPANGNFRARDRRTMQLLDPDTNLFHTLRIKVIDGVATIIPDQTGESA
jgi:hypothetical protein